MIEKYTPHSDSWDSERENFTPRISLRRPASLELYETNFAGEAAVLRRQLVERCRSLFAKLPDSTLEITEALAQGVVTEAEVIDLYQQLTHFLRQDPHHRRLLLYLPFEILPNLQLLTGKSEDLIEAERAFQDVYRTAWLHLLEESDVQANFIDGDILEPELGRGESKWIRKAAHLLPFLVPKGLVTISDIEQILESTPPSELARSLLAGLTVLNARPTEKSEPPRADDAPTIFSHLQQDLTLLVRQYAEGSEYITKMTPARLKWEKQARFEETITQRAGELVTAVIEGSFRPNIVSEFLQNSSSPECWAVVEAVFMAGEKLAMEDPDQARTLVATWQPLLIQLWADAPLALKDRCISGWNHWWRLGLVDEVTLNALGVPTPDLASPLPVDLETLSQTEYKDLSVSSRLLEQDPLLAESLYPFFLVFGSRIKGYGKLTADQDLAIFFKPTADWTRRTEILARVREVLPIRYAEEKILEFWLEEKNGQLGFKPRLIDIPTLVSGPQIHFLLGGVWLGNQHAIDAMRELVITKYTNLDRFGEQKEAVRFQLLRQLELDVIQYRLLHKGYRRFYPSAKQPGSAQANLIDWESDFWDPEFRRVATQLFLSRVFLPDVTSG